MGTQHIIGWEKGVAASATITVGATAATILVTVQLKDYKGTNLAQICRVTGYITSDAAGLTTSTVTSATVGSGIQNSIEATKSYEFVSTAAGVFSTTLDGTGANTRYLQVVLPNGTVVASGACVFSA